MPACVILFSAPFLGHWETRNNTDLHCVLADEAQLHWYILQSIHYIFIQWSPIPTWLRFIGAPKFWKRRSNLCEHSWSQTDWHTLSGSCNAASMHACLVVAVFITHWGVAKYTLHGFDCVSYQLSEHDQPLGHMIMYYCFKWDSSHNSMHYECHTHFIMRQNWLEIMLERQGKWASFLEGI